MRIIGGQYRGKKLISPKSDSVRPTSDQSRESVFNILNSKLHKAWGDIALLDIYTGTGAFALEAISRGIKSATLIDLDTSNAAKNIALFPKEQNKIKLLRTDATKLPKSDKKYDLIFMDAPYQKQFSEKTLDSLIKGDYLDNNTIIIVELYKDEELIPSSNLELIDQRIYGIAQFLFLRQKK